MPRLQVGLHKAATVSDRQIQWRLNQLKLPVEQGLFPVNYQEMAIALSKTKTWKKRLEIARKNSRKKRPPRRPRKPWKMSQNDRNASESSQHPFPTRFQTFLPSGRVQQQALKSAALILPRRTLTPASGLYILDLKKDTLSTLLQPALEYCYRQSETTIRILSTAAFKQCPFFSNPTPKTPLYTDRALLPLPQPTLSNIDIIICTLLFARANIADIIFLRKVTKWG